MSDIDEVKSRLNIVDIISERVRLKKTGRNFKGLCPFHSEKTPSFIVSPDRQIFKCFGCGKGGSVIDFIMENDHVDFGEALEMLAAKAGVKLERRVPETAEGKTKQRIYEVNHLTSEFYHFLLTKHKLGQKARLYLKNRGISDKSIKTFALGYSPNSWDGLLKFLRKKGYEEELLDKAGLVIKGKTYYDRFRGRVMFTLKDHRGNVVGFAGRLLDPDAKDPTSLRSSGQEQPKYINTSETPVYVKSNVLYGLEITKDAIAKANEAVVMEGELDVISSFQAGIGNVVAIKGSALTDGHVRLLRRFTERIALALDSDVAGDAAARRGIEIADAAGLDMRVVVLPSGKDPDEAARTNPGLLKKAIKEAIPIYDYFISSAIARFDGESAFGKKKISEELIPVLAKIDNPVVQNHYIKKLAKTLDVAEQTVIEAIEKLKRQQGRPVKSQEESLPAHVVARSRPEKLEIYILALLLQGKTVELFEDLKDEAGLSDFRQPAVTQILVRLKKSLESQEGRQVFLLKDFADNLPKELSATLDEAFLWDIVNLLESEEAFSREWIYALREFRLATLRRKIATMTQTIRDKDTKKEDIRQFQNTLRQLAAELGSLEKRVAI